MLPPVPDPEPGWSQSLYAGAGGMALLHIECARAGAGDWDMAHRWAAAMTRHPVTAHPDVSGLDRGAPAVAFVLHAAARPGYASALAVLDEHVTTLTRHRLRRAHARIEDGRLPALGEFDLIRGLTGIGVYLLQRHGGGDILREVLSYLVRLTEPLRTASGERLPGWWSDSAPDDRPSPRWPGGHGNLGMAHGIAGPLALLSSAMRSEVIVPGHADAIARICDWLDGWRVEAGRRTWWPETVSASELRDGVPRRAGPGRPSWCYGTPGLARAQQLAGLALADERRQQLAEQALAGSVTDERQVAQLNDASLCHGWAGLVQTAWRVAADAGQPEPLAPRRLLQCLEQHLERDGPPAHDGLLEGWAGIHLVRRTIAAGKVPVSGWDACLLLDAGRNQRSACTTR